MGKMMRFLRQLFVEEMLTILAFNINKRVVSTQKSERRPFFRVENYTTASLPGFCKTRESAGLWSSVGPARNQFGLGLGLGGLVVVVRDASLSSSSLRL
jgi:hypothetical protein